MPEINPNQNQRPLSDYFKYSPEFGGTWNIESAVRDDYNERFESLPESVRKLLTSPQTSRTLQEIAISKKLPREGLDLPVIVREVLSGISFLGDLAILVERRCGIDQNLAREVSNNIVSSLFMPAIEDIKQVQNQTAGLRGESVKKELDKTPANPTVTSTPPPTKSFSNVIDLRQKT